MDPGKKYLTQACSCKWPQNPQWPLRRVGALFKTQIKRDNNQTNVKISGNKDI